MGKFKFAALVSLTCLMSLFFHGAVGSQSPHSTVRLTTNPPLNQIRPFEAESTISSPPIQVTLQAVDAAEQLLKNVSIHLKILAPAKTPWFTTDFPIVEGTELLDLETTTANGELQLQQTFPIRGTYQFLVSVAPLVKDSFTPFEQTLTLTLPENGIKYRNFVILAIVLLAVGLGGGWVIGGRHSIQAGEIAPQQVRLLLSGAIVVAIGALLWINLQAEVAQLHHSMPMSHMAEMAPPSSLPAKVQANGLGLELSGDITATVGKPAHLSVSLVDLKTKQPVTDVVFKVTTTQLEDNWVALAYQTAPKPDGVLTWQHQFFDGAPHQIKVDVLPQPGAPRQFPPLQVGQTIAVEGVAPPLHVRLITLTYLTAIVAIGLLLGLWLRKEQVRTRKGRIASDSV